MSFNRAQRRAFKKVNPSMRYASNDDIDMALQAFVRARENNVLHEGDRVMLKYDEIMKQKDIRSPLFMKFVEENKDREFTVGSEGMTPEGSSKFVVLNEDDSDIKWKFFVGHLTKINVDVKSYFEQTGLGMLPETTENEDNNQ